MIQYELIFFSDFFCPTKIFEVADDTTLMAESEEELKSLLKVKEESEKVA